MTANPRPEGYDLVILGSGAGAKLLAWTFASRGQRAAAVERIASRYVEWVRVFTEARVKQQVASS